MGGCDFLIKLKIVQKFSPGMLITISVCFTLSQIINKRIPVLVHSNLVLCTVKEIFYSSQKV